MEEKLILLLSIHYNMFMSYSLKEINFILMYQTNFRSNNFDSVYL